VDKAIFILPILSSCQKLFTVSDVVVAFAPPTLTVLSL